MTNSLAQFGSTDFALQYLRTYDSEISNRLDLSVIKSNLSQLDLLESIIPQSQQFDLHFDLIINGGANSITKYYKDLLKGKNVILEKAKSSVTAGQIKKINEAIEKFKKSSRLNEQIAVVGKNDPFASISKGLTNTLNKAKSSMPQSQSPDANIQTTSSSTSATDLLSDLWNALTENQSGIGILHLILDIVGILGDGVFAVTGVPVGTIADILNSIIYFVRGKWMLGTISLIAGLLPGAGDTLKTYKAAASSAEKVMLSGVKTGSKEASEELAKLSVKEQGPVIKLLRFISKNISSVLGKAMNILSKFFSTFLSKVVGWIPFIGGKLEIFFDSIGNIFSKYSQKMSKFADEFTTIEKDALSVAAKNADNSVSKMFKEKGNMVVDHSSNTVQCFDASGKAIGAPFSTELLTNAKVINAKYPSLFKIGDPKAVVDYYNAVAKTEKTIGQSTASQLLKKGLLKTVGHASKLSMFIGKQIIKLLTNTDASKSGYSEEEIRYWGNSALQDWIRQLEKKQREETGATYIPAITLDSSDKEVFDNITAYQNNYAKLFGQPSIIPVIYDKFGNDEVEQEFDDFFKAVAEGKIKREDTEPEEKNDSDSNEKSNESFKYILSYSSFIRN